MHEVLEKLKSELDDLIKEVESKIPNEEPFGIAHGNWSFPELTRSELVEEAQSIVDLIDDHHTDDLGKSEKRLADYTRRIQYLRSNTVPNIWGNAASAVPAYLLTLNGLRSSLRSALTFDQQKEASKRLRNLRNQLRGMEARLREIEPRTGTLAEMVERIEKAYEAADQLPADLESLTEARQKIAELERAAAKDQAQIGVLREKGEGLDTELKQIAEEAASILKRCETAYSAATSVGLAAAFSERSSSLAQSMWAWVIGLIAALGIGGWLGYVRIQDLKEVVGVPNASATVVSLNVLLSALAVGAPIWFAWLATKQIGQRFRLAEDYAFKASVSRAYEGYRREAASVDKDLEVRLLASALTRLDELPLRLVEPDSHGSPVHELTSSELVRRAMDSVPGFTDRVKDLAAQGIAAVGASATSLRKGEKRKPSAPTAAEDDQDEPEEQ